MTSDAVESRSQTYRRRKKSGGYVQGDPSTLASEVLRKHAAELTCPWCDEGPFRNLGTHVFLAHGVSARELKLAARIPLDLPLIAPDVSVKLSDSWLRHEDQNLQLLRSVSERGVEAALKVSTPLRQSRRLVGLCPSCTRQMSAALADCRDSEHMDRRRVRAATSRLRMQTLRLSIQEPD